MILTHESRGGEKKNNSKEVSTWATVRKHEKAKGLQNHTWNELNCKGSNG